MKWFKHDSNANTDAKLRKLRLKYGMEGYGLYWYCLELIAQNVEKHNLTFELEHDAEILAHDTGIHFERVQEMMNDMVKLGLFENNTGAITCMKMAMRLDETTSKHPSIKLLQDSIRSRSIQSPDSLPTISGQSPARTEQNRTDKNRTEETPLSGDARPQSDVKAVFQYWQQKLNHPQAKLTPERQRKISTALKNYSAASLCQAIDGCAVTPHNMGQNDRGEVYDDIELILRDAKHIERFAHNAESPPKPNGGHHAKPSKLQQAAEAIRASHQHRTADVQDAGTEPRLRAISGGSAGGHSGDD
jgi:hypothetical protein